MRQISVICVLSIFFEYLNFSDNWRPVQPINAYVRKVIFFNTALDLKRGQSYPYERK